jgi:hypothetical protein
MSLKDDWSLWMLEEEASKHWMVDIGTLRKLHLRDEDEVAYIEDLRSCIECLPLKSAIVPEFKEK